MGCGSSTAAGTLGASLEKDPEDLTVDQFKLNRVAVPAFDEWFGKLETPVNEVIGMSNKLNDMVTEILVAGALVSGGYTLKLETEGIVSHDHVLLSLVKADGTAPTAEEVDAAAKKPEVAKADTELAAARAALHSELNSAQVALTVGPDGKLAPAGAAIDRLNAAVAEFNKVAAPLKATLVAKKSPAPGARTFSAKLIKPHFKPSADNMNDPSVPEEHTLTLLDAAKTATGKQILACESLAVDQSFQVAVACKDATELSIKLAEACKYRIAVTHTVTDEKKKAAIDKAVAGANIAAFKLLKSLYTIKGPVTLGTSLVSVVKAAFEKAERLAGDAVKKAIKFDVKFAVKEDHSIDFDLKPEFPNTNWAWPEILPGPAKLAMNTVLALIEEIKAMVGTFQILQEKVNALIEESKELFADPGTKFQEAGLDMMAAGKAAASLARNTAKITGSATVVAAFLQTVQRVAGQLQETATAIPKEVEALTK